MYYILNKCHILHKGEVVKNININFKIRSKMSYNFLQKKKYFQFYLEISLMLLVVFYLYHKRIFLLYHTPSSLLILYRFYWIDSYFKVIKYKIQVINKLLEKLLTRNCNFIKYRPKIFLSRIVLMNILCAVQP